MTERDFVPSTYTEKKAEGKSTWKSPSNIALVKYWGKKENQIPANPSISFTLEHCTTTTTLEYRLLDKKAKDFSFDLLFEGKEKESFKPKITTFLSRIEAYLPFLKDYHFKISTSNSFPHSSGIASSASGMSALALCLMDIEKELNSGMKEADYFRKASFLSRLGSGSACRSIYGGLVTWGQHPRIPNSSDLYGLPYSYDLHPVFRNYQDTILLVHKGEKTVSSTAGHNLMHGHWFANSRFEQANANLSRLQEVFKTGDLDSFITIVESEALTLHAMMMSSEPYFILMKPNTLHIIERIWAFRKEQGVPVCFTLDAGANVHLLFPESEKEAVDQFVQNELVAFCQKGQYICDQIGMGPKNG
ncbi:diphosphomevalonate/mevalonate 3,5-bisphosphate decarboxylase family protein [Poritiphilus flavus]|uniref:Diphosphomevalonate decarboxylase n=1 Tax=Poritiphilus flavus TaxID=2697053 RepID=A0A6L9EDP3_9FLAO|nr:diphosphomevalonate decarboxylase [Poritiphilus flavus]NAS12761.1 diphosphomevalonate decarboxylase [Poritiphilus flavus]